MAKSGLICPKCGCPDLRHPEKPWLTVKVVKLRHFIRRYRVCRNCGYQIKTREWIEATSQ